MDKLKSFASLAWYDACIEFLFKLAAKTSEPLLAIGMTPTLIILYSYVQYLVEQKHAICKAYAASRAM